MLCEDLAPLDTGTPRDGVWPFFSAVEVTLSDRDLVNPVLLLHEKPCHFMVKNKGLLVTDVVV